MEISREEVEHVAKLARLALSEQEKMEMTQHLTRILTYMETLNGVDTSQCTPTSHVVSMSNVMREDQIQPSLEREKALSNAPDRTDEYFRVPKVID